MRESVITGDHLDMIWHERDILDIRDMVNKDCNLHQILEKYDRDPLEIIILVDWLHSKQKVKDTHNVFGLRKIPIKAFCMKCKKQYDQMPNGKCECGNKTYAQGELKIVDNEITCACGSTHLKIVDFVDGKQCWKREDECMMCKRHVLVKGVKVSGKAK